jgi:hypothetical protein
MFSFAPRAATGGVCLALFLFSASDRVVAQAGTQWAARGVGITGNALAAAPRVSPGANTIVAFGGTLNQATTSIYNGTTWTTVTTPVSPSPRGLHAMASIGNSVLLFGGSSLGGLLGDTWLFNGSTWTNLNIAGPAARSDHAMAPYAGGVLLFGGLGTGTGGNVLLGDTWFFNGATWQLLTNSGPSVRYAPSMAEHPIAGNEVVLFGGVGTGGTVFNDTYLFSNGAWFLQAPTSAPAASFGNFRLPMVYDSYRRRVVLMDFAGHANGNMWEWVAGDWAQRHAWGPGQMTLRAFFQDQRSATDPGLMIAVSNNTTHGYGPVNPGRFVTAGTSAGPRIVLDSAYGDVLWKGENMTITANGFAANGAAPMLMLSPVLYSPPIDLSAFGAPGYFLYVDANQGVSVQMNFVPAAGTASLTILVPSSTALLAQLHFQCYQAIAGVNPLNAVFTDYATGTVGAK